MFLLLGSPSAMVFLNPPTLYNLRQEATSNIPTPKRRSIEDSSVLLAVQYFPSPNPRNGIPLGGRLVVGVGRISFHSRTVQLIAANPSPSNSCDVLTHLRTHAPAVWHGDSITDKICSMGWAGQRAPTKVIRWLFKEKGMTLSKQQGNQSIYNHI